MTTSAMIKINNVNTKTQKIICKFYVELVSKNGMNINQNPNLVNVI